MSLSLNSIIEFAQGNPGALSMLTQLIGNPEHQIILDTLGKATTIRGSKIWVLYNDLADRDISVVAKLCANTPIAILEDACARSDYSGLELVNQYK